MKSLLIAGLVGALTLLGGCDDDRTPATPAAPAAPATPAAPAASAAAPKDEQHARVPIGETTVGGLKLVATQDAPLKAGGEGAFDLVITGGKPKAVRFWVGTEDASGSVKAKAEEESADTWHTHVEVPDPLPAGAKFWAEVEPPTGAKFTVSFDPKR